MNTKILCRLFVAILPLLMARQLSAQVPNLINYQGRLTDVQGNPVTGNRTMAVKVYDAPTGGNLTYEETIGTVSVKNGAYSFRFGSGGSVAVSANETIATTNGINQVFGGALQGAPAGDEVSLTDGTFSWTSFGGSSDPLAFSVTYNGTARSFQIIYLTQVPAAGRSIVASYQTLHNRTIESALVSATAHLALSINGTEENERSRLLTVPYALKSNESLDAQQLSTVVNSLSDEISEVSAGASSGLSTLASGAASLSTLTSVGLNGLIMSDNSLSTHLSWIAGSLSAPTGELSTISSAVEASLSTATASLSTHTSVGLSTLNTSDNSLSTHLSWISSTMDSNAISQSSALSTTNSCLVAGDTSLSMATNSLSTATSYALSTLESRLQALENK